LGDASEGGFREIIKMRVVSILAAVAALAFGAFAMAEQRVAAPAPTKNIVATAVEAGQFKTLASLLQSAGLVDALQGPGPFTVFAPTDEAFAKVPKAQLEALGKNPEMLKQVLLYHVVPGSISAKQITAFTSAEAKTLQGKNVKIKVDEKGVHVNTAKVIKADVMASNGVIHVIDSVILPPQ
jgi:uncharacterized surface protein with fasciclin (FAS1) repeats